MAKKPPHDDDQTERTIDAIILVASEVGFDGKQWKVLADELNNRGVTTVTKKPFNSESLRSFCNRSNIDFAKIREAADPTELPQQPTALPQWLQDDLDSLQTLLQWWKSQPTGRMTLLDVTERRPVFVGKTRNSGIRINEVILARAVDKAKEEKHQTGGNLSQLVEWLLWRYLGEPLDVVEGSEQAE